MHLTALVFALVANAVANISIKAASKAHAGDDSALAQVLDWRFLAGLVAFGLALGGYSLALKRFDLSLGYPVMTGGGLILVTLASALLFKEPITALRLTGMAVILAGVVLVTWPTGSPTLPA